MCLFSYMWCFRRMANIYRARNLLFVRNCVSLHTELALAVIWIVLSLDLRISTSGYYRHCVMSPAGAIVTTISQCLFVAGFLHNISYKLWLSRAVHYMVDFLAFGLSNFLHYPGATPLTIYGLSLRNFVFYQRLRSQSFRPCLHLSARHIFLLWLPILTILTSFDAPNALAASELHRILHYPIHTLSDHLPSVETTLSEPRFIIFCQMTW